LTPEQQGFYSRFVRDYEAAFLEERHKHPNESAATIHSRLQRRIRAVSTQVMDAQARQYPRVRRTPSRRAQQQQSREQQSVNRRTRVRENVKQAERKASSPVPRPSYARPGRQSLSQPQAQPEEAPQEEWYDGAQEQQQAGSPVFLPGSQSSPGRPINLPSPSVFGPLPSSPMPLPSSPNLAQYSPSPAPAPFAAASPGAEFPTSIVYEPDIFDLPGSQIRYPSPPPPAEGFEF
jgi:hypothetical protein